MSTLPTHSRQTLIWRKKVVAVHTAVQMKLHIVEDGPWQVPHSSGQTCHEDWTRSFKIARPILLFALKLGFKVNWCWGINSWELGTVSGCRLFSLEAMSFAHQYAELLKFVSPELLPQDWMCDEKLCKTQPATMRAVRKKVCSTTCRRAKDTEGARTDKLDHKTINWYQRTEIGHSAQACTRTNKQHKARLDLLEYTEQRAETTISALFFTTSSAAHL